MTLTVQIILITGSEKRKALMLQQFMELNIPFPVYFLQASLPENSTSYLPSECSDVEKRTMCCALSHFRAIEQAAFETSPDVTIIMEDDAALHKEKFVPTVLELLRGWETLIPNDSHMVSLGWTPMKNYSFYEEAKSDKTINCLKDSKILPWFCYGLMAYMIKRTSALKFYPILKQRTYAELVAAVHKEDNKYIPKENRILNVDDWINRLLIQTAIFPLVVIEQRGLSILNNKTDMYGVLWDTFFKGYEDVRKEYWSF